MGCRALFKASNSIMPVRGGGAPPVGFEGGLTPILANVKKILKQNGKQEQVICSPCPILYFLFYYESPSAMIIKTGVLE
jgi:hypothetical protein